MIKRKYIDTNLTKFMLEDVKHVYDAYEKYLKNPEDKMLYMYLKQAIYNLSLTIKAELVTGEINRAKAEEMKEYFWGLLL